MKFTSVYTNPKKFTSVVSVMKAPYDSCDGTTIDTARWTVTNPDATVARFIMQGGLVMDSLLGVNANTYANNIKSTKTQDFGCWKFSFLDIERYLILSRAREVGLINADETHRICFKRDGTDSDNIRFFIIDGASTLYSITTGIWDFAQFKINITSSHAISCYKWANDAWLQVGVPFTFDAGALAFYMATGGNMNVRTVVRDIYIQSTDLTTLYE